MRRDYEEEEGFYEKYFGGQPVKTVFNDYSSLKDEQTEIMASQRALILAGLKELPAGLKINIEADSVRFAPWAMVVSHLSPENTRIETVIEVPTPTSAQYLVHPGNVITGLSFATPAEVVEYLKTEAAKYWTPARLEEKKQQDEVLAQEQEREAGLRLEATALSYSLQRIQIGRPYFELLAGDLKKELSRLLPQKQLETFSKPEIEQFVVDAKKFIAEKLEPALVVARKSYEGATLSFVSERFRLVGSDNSDTWVFDVDGHEIEPDGGRGTAMQGRREWQLITGDKLVVRWVKDSYGSPHRFDVIQLPVDGVTAQQIATTQQTAEQVVASWQERDSKHQVGSGWDLKVGQKNSFAYPPEITAEPVITISLPPPKVEAISPPLAQGESVRRSSPVVVRPPLAIKAEKPLSPEEIKQKQERDLLLIKTLPISIEANLRRVPKEKEGQLPPLRKKFVALQDRKKNPKDAEAVALGLVDLDRQSSLLCGASPSSVWFALYENLQQELVKVGRASSLEVTPETMNALAPKLVELAKSAQPGEVALDKLGELEELLIDI